MMFLRLNDESTPEVHAFNAITGKQEALVVDVNATIEEVQTAVADRNPFVELYSNSFM